LRKVAVKLILKIQIILLEEANHTIGLVDLHKAVVFGLRRDERVLVQLCRSRN
jgi:hypothetical protein